MLKSIVTVNKMVLEDTLKYNGVTVLTYKIEYPKFDSSANQIALFKINNYYRTKAMEYQKYIQTELYKTAVDEYNYAVKNGFPVRAFEALAVYIITYNRACIISLYFDQYEYTAGAHGNTIRTSQTWNIQKGTQVKLGELFTCPMDYKAYMINLINEQIKKEPEIYFEDYKKLVVENFNENSFYVTSDGIVVYYQQYDIAPYASGIREFIIPYGKCVKEPKDLC